MRENCMSHWFPILEQTGVPVPKTAIVKTQEHLASLLDLEDGSDDRYIQEVIAKANFIIGDDWKAPLFMRTGHFSGKHSWLDTCFIKSLKDIPEQMCQLAMESELVSLMGLPSNVWVFREFLSLESYFTAFNGFPVNKERRYFVSGGKVLCHHPYWPPDSILDPSVENWEELLAQLNEETPKEVAELTRMAEIVSAAFGDEAWSVDFAQKTDGHWACIDMALAATSFHWEGCQ